MGSQFDVSANQITNWITYTILNFSNHEDGDVSDNESLTLPLTELTEKISRISYHHFLNQLKVCVDDLNKNTEMRNPQNVGILVNNLKSNGWVAALARDKMGFQGNYYALGSAHAKDFIEYLKNANVEILPKHFVLFDDASFSGNQMHDHLVAINDELSALSNKRFSLHVAVPFITSVALKRLQSIKKKPISISIFLLIRRWQQSKSY
jgi:hypothetical protein